jgi:dihydrofolate reductase/thymidylate synthase
MTFEMIVAIDTNGGIGFEGNLPWFCKKELQIFKQKTLGHALVVGRKTFNRLPNLTDRDIFCLSRNNSNVEIGKNKCKIINTLNSDEIKLNDKKVFIAGGKLVYEEAIKSKMVSIIHLSIMNKIYECDTFLDLSIFENYVIIERKVEEEFTHFVLEKSSREENECQYLNLIRDVLENGKMGDSRNSKTLSVFARNLTFDLTKGFPLLTTKKMFIRGIIEEALFFLRGQTDSKILEAKNVNIWKGNTSREFLDSLGMFDRREGLLGPMYGYQWRHFGAFYNENQSIPTERGIDQLNNIIEMIKTEPYSRRILMTTYNPEQTDKGVLPPCHSIVTQFYVEDEFLDLFCYNRSQDLFLGVPFNISSSAILLSIVAKLTNKTPRFLHIGMGNVHIYESHIEACKIQASRLPFKFPTLIIPEINSLQDLDNESKVNAENFILENYNSHPSIKCAMIV